MLSKILKVIGSIPWLMLNLVVLLVVMINHTVLVEDNLPAEPLKYKGFEVYDTNIKGASIVYLNQIVAKKPEEFQASLEHYQDINSDTVGVIQIPDFGIDYPVLFSQDNKKYLRTNIYLEADVQGAISLDANYNDILSPVKLIHGHNMKNGQMFAPLPQLLKWESLDQAPAILYYDRLGLKIFSVFSVNAKEESMIVENGKTIEELEKIKEDYIDRSWVPVSKVPAGLEMMMLNTCWYGVSGTEHFLHCIVVAARVD